MSKFLILHGTDASPDANWFMWLEGKLIGEGHEVWLPLLPNSDKPNAKTYTKFILDNKDFVIDSDTVLIGHSSGSVEILNLLQNLPNETMVKGSILVSVFENDLGWESLTGLFEETFDFDIIKSHCQQFILIHSDNDPYVPLEQAESIKEKINGTLILLDGQGHFNTELGPEYKQFPQLLEIIESIS